MKLTDQEQVILKAVGHGVAQISRVIKAVGYPKATTKKVLVGLSNKGVVSLHRHDWPQSLTPAERKLMVRIGHDYYGAVSVREKNPKGKHLRGATAKQQRQYEHILESAKEYGRYGRRKKEVAARTVKARQNPKKTGKGKAVLKKTGRALKGFARGALGAASEIFGAGAEALNPVRRKVRNKYIDLVIKGQAKKTPQGWRVGKKTFTQGRGTVNVSSGYYLDRHTGMVYAKRDRNKSRKRNVEAGAYYGGAFHPYRSSSDYDPAIVGETGRKPRRTKNKKKKAAVAKAIKTASHKRKVSSRRATTKRLASRAVKKAVKSRKRRNVERGFYDSTGFHPMRESKDYDSVVAGETGGKPRRTRSKKRIAAKKKAVATYRTRSMVARRKKTTSRLAGRSIKKSSGLLKKGRKRTNPSAEHIRKDFAGSVLGERDLFFPQGTPSGKLAKLGKLVSITTEEGTIKPVSGTAWLCADTKGKLHIGSVTGAPLFDGPKRSFGHVTKLEYESSKPHLGYKGPIIWFHRAGEENGVRPTLKADGSGGLVFKGGDYRLTKRGIEN